jgi:hypothetical protein
MSELIVYKANELAVSRYDLTEQETKLILYCIGCINPSLSGMTIQEGLLSLVIKNMQSIWVYLMT